MDSFTQAVLGAAIGEAALGRHAGRKAALWGAVCGTLPDLDSFYPFADPVSAFTYHRGISHSLIVLSALTPVVAWLIARIHRGERPRFGRWLLTVWLCLITHPLLDACTTYGTQLLWPFDDTPIAWNNVFIIDPAFTLPLLLAVLAALVLRPVPPNAERRRALGAWLNRLALAWGIAYLVLGAFIKTHVDSHVRASAERQGIAVQRYIATPILFNIVLWRAVIMSDDRYYEAFYSLLDDPGEVRFKGFETDPALLEPLNGNWAVQRLKWFTRGFHSVSRVDDRVVLSDLRMGYEPAYVFRFVLGKRIGGTTTALPVIKLPQPSPGIDVLAAGWRRLLGDREAL
ncbi:MAG: metal-dependent hydrolase [Gammaproteobacteria bacterium]